MHPLRALAWNPSQAPKGTLNLILGIWTWDPNQCVRNYWHCISFPTFSSRIRMYSRWNRKDWNRLRQSTQCSLLKLSKSFWSWLSVEIPPAPFPQYSTSPWTFLDTSFKLSDFIWRYNSIVLIICSKKSPCFLPRLLFQFSKPKRTFRGISDTWWSVRCNAF